MGHVDIEKVNKIYRACVDFSKLCSLPFQFKEDSGHKETVISISELGKISQRLEPNGSLSDLWRTFVPDVLDFHNKIIIEFEETPGKPRPGAKLAKKGHDPDGNDIRTSWRDLYYDIGKFRLLKIFDYEFKSESLWRIKLFRFLMICHENKLAEGPMRVQK